MLNGWDLRIPTMRLVQQKRSFLAGTKKAIGANAVIVDPPRTGLGTKLIETLLHYAPEKMVYVSCNVSTLARDLVALTKVYQVEYIQSVDMFPHTARTEAVVKLVKK